ncbi:MAG: c-type cytochrome [Ignavibacteriales bacterium]|nr:c-type cytochrome [Ignavibacteriales bacterium]
MKTKLEMVVLGKKFLFTNIVAAFLMLQNNTFAVEGSGFDADTYINTGFLIFFIYVLVMTIIFLIGQNKKPEEEIEMVRKLDQLINDTKPIEEEHALLLDPNYDRIRALDINLPPCWKYLSYATTVSSVVYMGYYHISNGPSSAQEYEQEVRQAQLALAATSGQATVNVDNVKMLSDAASLAKGKDIYDKNCASCHGMKGEGLVGPNLTDDYWIHGGSIQQIFVVLVNGVLVKGMPSWRAQFSSQDLEAAGSYVKSLHGTNPPNAKEAQGDLLKKKL